MKVGPLQVEIHGAPARRVMPTHDEAYYFESIHALCRMLDEIPWLLAGGLAVPFTLGGFFREHDDIDIMVPCASMPAACIQFRSAGYQLFKRVIFSHNARSIVVRYPVEPGTEVRPNLNYAMLRLKDQSKYRILDKIDIHPYQIKDGILESDYRGPMLEVSDSVQSLSIKTGHKTQFKCLDLRYVARLKQARHGTKHQIDLIAIEQGVKTAASKVQQCST